MKGVKSSNFSKLLASTALGKNKADLVIKNSLLVNVYSGEIIENTDVSVKKNRIALVGDAEHTIGDETKVIDAEGKYLAPGFLDGHVHIDDSMGTVTEFARVVLPKGTTGVFMDPHEIANVLGLEGVKLMMEEAKKVPLRVYTTIPSCVPSTSPNLETAGASIGAEEIKEAMKWEGTVALGEMMNYPGVVFGEDQPHSMIEETLEAGKVVEGHAPELDSEKLNAYISAGITSCHESTTKSEALQKLRLGMYLMIREGFESIKNLSELIRIITEEDIETNRISLVTDDRHPEDLVEEGHMNHVVKRAIEEGVDPVNAIRMATLNTASHFKLDDVVGGIAPGRFADMLILDDLSKVSINEVIADGNIIAKDGELLKKIDYFEYPERAKNTVHVPSRIKSTDFEIETNTKEETEVRVIGVKEDSPATEHLKRKLPIEEGVIKTNSENEIAKTAVIERHQGTGNIGLGFVEGFGFKKGATASTIAHDSHNLLVIGTKDDDMALAANKLAEVGGGLVTVKDGEVLELVELPIAGLMSDRPLEETQKKMTRIGKTWDKLSCKMKHPFPTIILLALPVLPKLRITDKGLVDTINFELLNVET